MDTISNKHLDNYEKILGRGSLKNVRELGKELKGKKVLHVNSTKYGGGVAEILNTLVPLLNELEIETEWKVFTAEDSFFEISKKMHNALQGNMDIHFSEQEISNYMKQAERSYNQIKPDSDFNIIHDPQPCPMINFEKNKKGKWIWRCHIDTANPNPQAWNMISPYLPLYDALIFSREQYAKPGIHKFIYEMPPSIDPLSDKNKFIDENTAKKIVEKYVPTDLPLITQVSRFDPWKDPLGVIEAFRKAKEKKKARLALVGSLATDDPEGGRLLEKIKETIGDNPDIFVLSNQDGIGNLEVNAFQRISDIILQKSIKEGFGLTVSEALWKETPVIGGNVGGIQLQIKNGVNGFLVNSIDETADKILYLLNNPKEAKEMGIKGKELVKNNFLITKHLENYLKLFQMLSV